MRQLPVFPKINTLFPVVHFLKCVVAEVVLFSMVAFKTLDISQGSVATHLRCGEIFSDSIITNILLMPTVKCLKIGQYLMKLRRTKMVTILGHPVYPHWETYEGSVGLTDNTSIQWQGHKEAC